MIKAILGKSRYQLPMLPTPGEAHAKLAQAAGRARQGADQQAAEAAVAPTGSAGLGSRRRCIAAPTSGAPTKPSRDVEAWLKCRYMREHLGEEYGGTVSAVTSFGIFVTLDALYVEGLVHITELGGEYFRFDEVRQELRGERTGIRYAIGTRVRVQVSRVDLDGRKIDFRLVREGEEAARALRTRRDKAAGAATRRRASSSRCKDADRAVKAAPRRKARARSGASRGRRAPARRRRASRPADVGAREARRDS